MEDLYCLAQTTVDVLRTSKLTIATAESLTGGMISSAIVDIAGASDVFRGGFVTYQTEMKATLLDINPDLIKKFNVVSDKVAIEMAYNARIKIGSDLAVSVTGLAGPNGGTEKIPVGTVFVGISTQDRSYAIPLHLEGDRFEIRHTTVARALQFALREALNIYGATEMSRTEEKEGVFNG